eukprot:8846451-Lingulodinium_polyedra.AAC.1
MAWSVAGSTGASVAASSATSLASSVGIYRCMCCGVYSGLSVVFKAWVATLRQEFASSNNAEV